MSNSSKLWLYFVGAVYIVLGIYLVLNPAISIGSLSLMLAFNFFLGAVSSLVLYFRLPAALRHWEHLVTAIVSFIFAVYLLAYGYVALPIVIPVVIGLWLLYVGCTNLFRGFRTSKEMPRLRNGFLFVGAVSLLLGLFLSLNPLAASLVVAFIFAVGLIYQGIDYLRLGREL